MFHKVLIANRGEIACRVARTCKKLGVASVAVYSEADERSLHRAAADEAVPIGPAPVRASYLDAERIVEAARRTGAEAIHPGYGLLSENADFARKVTEAGLVFVGPPADVLALVGDKMRARAMAARANVAPVPGAMEPVPDLGAAREVAERVGYPVIVKAVGGGGGIGMQVVRDPAALERAFKACSDRGKAAFADPRAYIEAYLPAGRHVEVQILCDAAGGRVALGERECSMQRRHQKIVEESPAPAATPDLQSSLAAAALRIAGASGYVNAGTCEFLLDGQGRFHFLEVNARLQVEHPVTEMVTGLDLVEEQLRIASGEALTRTALSARVNGHAIEVRIYAENPDKAFFPSPGKIDRLRWPETADDLRVEAGVAQGDAVTPHYDPLIAKIVASGRDREAARRRLEEALSRTEISPLVTNLAFLRSLIASEPFATGQYDTTTAEAGTRRGGDTHPVRK